MKSSILRPAAALLLTGVLSAAGAWAVAASPGGLADRTSGAGVAQHDPQDGSAVHVDDQDNVVKQLGETAGLVDQDGKTVFTLDVESVSAQETCPARVGEKSLTSTNGTFLYVKVTAALDEQIHQSVPGSNEEMFLPLVAEAFSVTGADGTVHEAVSSETSWGCLSEDELLPAMVNPGQTQHGIVVLDSPVTEGTVTYDPDHTGGWSWAFDTDTEGTR